MTFDDLINNLDKLIQNIQAELPRITEKFAGDAVAEAWQRIEKEGAREGAKYSTEPMYASQSIFNNKGSFNPRGKALKKNKAARTMYLPSGYEELRSIQGLPVNVVNLDYTGMSRRNTQVLDVINKGQFNVRAIVGWSRQEEKNKMNGAFKRYGDFLAITPEIAKVINPIPAKRIVEIIKNTLG